MKNVLTRALFVSLAAGLAVACRSHSDDQPEKSGGKQTHDELLGAPSLKVDDAKADLKQTSVVAVLSTVHEPETSYLWCSTFQLAWNELDSYLGGPVQVAGPGAEGLSLLAALQASSAGSGDLDEASFVAKAGQGNEILKVIRDELQTKFQGAASPSLLPQTLPKDGILAYAYLFKNLSFEQPLLKREVQLVFGTANVRAFGLWPDARSQDRQAQASQIDILTYDSPDRWCVELQTKSQDDRLLIARLEPGRTLQDTVDAAIAMSTGVTSKRMERNDRLVIPMMNFDVTRSYDELVGFSLAGSNRGGNISSAIQNIRLRLDEKGAILKSEAVIGVTSAPMDENRPREMVCDGPFLMLMMREGKTLPYFAMCVANPEILESWDTKKAPDLKKTR